MTPRKAELGYLLVRGTLIVLAKLALTVLALVLNVALLWSYFWSGHRITPESPARIFAVVVLTQNNAELFLGPGKHDEYLELQEYLDAHPDYSFLIPSGSQAAVQEQIQASYHRRYSGKGQPYLKVKTLGADRQLIEITMAGDPHTDIFWYEARDKTIIPRYWQVFSCLHPLLILVLAPLLIVPEYFIARLLANVMGGWLLKPPSLTSSL